MFAGGADGGQSGTFTLHDLAELKDAQPVHIGGLKQVAQLIEGALFRGLAYKGSLALVTGHQAQAGQAADGSAHRDAAGGELGGQLRFGGELVSRLPDAGCDSVIQIAEHFLRYAAWSSLGHCSHLEILRCNTS